MSTWLYLVNIYMFWTKTKKYMKTLIILSCYTGWEMLFFYFLGVLSTVVVGFVLRAREQQIMKEKKDIEKLAHAIQRYYWLIKKGKSIEANKKALKKFISLFSNRIINSSPSAVEYALRSFRYGIFDSLRIKILGIYEPYKLQFQPKPDFNFDESARLAIPVEQKDIISSDDAISRIEKAFNEAEVKWYQNFCQRPWTVGSGFFLSFCSLSGYILIYFDVRFTKSFGTQFWWSLEK